MVTNMAQNPVLNPRAAQMAYIRASVEMKELKNKIPDRVQSP
jgi:hypothetical protein